MFIKFFIFLSIVWAFQLTLICKKFSFYTLSICAKNSCRHEYFRLFSKNVCVFSWLCLVNCKNREGSSKLRYVLFLLSSGGLVASSCVNTHLLEPPLYWSVLVGNSLGILASTWPLLVVYWILFLFELILSLCIWDFSDTWMDHLHIEIILFHVIYFIF